MELALLTRHESALGLEMRSLLAKAAAREKWANESVSNHLDLLGSALSKTENGEEKEVWRGIEMTVEEKRACVGGGG